MKILEGISKGYKSLMSSEDGSMSSKRFLGVVCVITLNVTLLFSLFINSQVQINTTLVDIIGLLAFGLLSLTSVDRYNILKNKDNKDDKNMQ